jgi:phosphohistidine swiveling domain-containing protein
VHAARRGARPGEPPRGRVLDLTDTEAADAAVAGAKAANLAKAAHAGLPVLPGLVLSTEGPIDPAGLRAAWHRISDGGRAALVVRSSSTVEDAGASSMAGQFRSVLGVRDAEAFQAAVAQVLESAKRLAEPGAPPAPMAVLVQPELAPVCAGVMFGVDPVTGDRRRMMVEAVRGSPHALVSGTVTAARYLLTRTGRIVERADTSVLDWRRRHRLARLGRRAERVFGGPQDIEWAFGEDNRLWLLQSRPVTAVGRHDAPVGPILGTGPVSETFPLPLGPLELDLWAAPLQQGIVDALRLTGSVSHRRLANSPVVTSVGGRLAVDLELLGVAPGHRSLARALDPRGPVRRLLAAWRVGRLRAALPHIATETIRQVDRHLVQVPTLPSLSEPDLIRLLRRITAELAVVHAQEVLAGMLLPSAEGGGAPSIALAALAAGRTAQLSDGEIVRRAPVVQALTPPRIGAAYPLPVAHQAVAARGGVRNLAERDALRLLARWLQELSARAATLLGERLQATGRLAAADLVKFLSLDELAALTSGGVAPSPEVLAERAATPTVPALPACFRRTDAGDVVPEPGGGRPAGGRAAGGGRGLGRVAGDTTSAAGEVLVVETLSPELAAALPGLAGLISETGSALSHLAILARELAVPTVVGVPDARRRFQPGALVVVDGGTGEVSLVAAQEGEPR